MFKKKLASMVLASAMVLSMNAVAFAADTTIQTPNSDTGAYSSDVTIDSEVKTPTIRITVPGSTKVAINPYKMSYSLGESKTSTDVLANPIQYIKNESDVAVSVSATTSAKPTDGGNAVIAAAALKGTETTKSVFAYLELKEAANNTDAVTFLDKYDAKEPTQLVFGTKATTKANMLKLAAGNTAATYAAFKVLGDVAATPSKAWTDADKIDLSLTFNFVPSVTE